MNQILKDNADDLAIYGNIVNLGSHSIRKGSATYCASGSTVAPSIVSICLRAGWTISGAKERYLKFEGAGDQFVSRVASGLDPTTKNFAVSPAYFEASNNDDEANIQGFFTRLYGAHIGVDRKVMHLCRMLLASIAYHYDWFMVESHPLNPFRVSTCAANLLPSIRSLAMIRYPWNKTEHTPHVTGIPPHVSIMTMLEVIISKQETLSGDVSSAIITEMDERGTFGGFNQNRMQTMLDGLMTEVRSEVRSARRNGGGGIFGVNDVADGVADGGVMTLNGRRFRYHTWGEKFHMLPETWVFPHGMNMQVLMNLWFCGIESEGVPPFRFVKKGCEVHHIPRGTKVLSDMKYLMKHMQRAIEELGMWSEDNWTEQRVRAVYNIVNGRFNFKSNPRYHSLAWSTTARALYRRKGKMIGED